MNDTCSVTLTDEGATLLNKRYSNKSYRAGDKYRAQLWALFMEFGPDTRIGLSLLFETDLDIECERHNDLPESPSNQPKARVRRRML